MNNNTNEEEITIDLGKILWQIWHNKIVIILVTVLCAALGYLASAFLMTPMYEASADMFVNNRNDSSTSTAVTQSDLNASSSLVSTYSIILKSHNVLEQVIRDCSLDYSYKQLSRMTSVSSVSSTQVMRVTVKSKDPQEALDIVTDIVRLAPDAIMKSVDAGSVSTVDAPWTDGRPVSPSKTRNTAIAGMLGLLLCLAVIVIREITNDKFKTTDDVRQILDLNILGVIPIEETVSRSTKKSSGRKRKGSKKA